MKTSRTEGILILATKKPYKVAIEGNLEERFEIICHDVNSKCEAAAADMEQLIIRGLTAIPEGQSKASKKQMMKDEKKDKDFFENDTPSDKEINEQAQNLQMIMQMNGAVNISELMDIFQEILAAGVIEYAGGKKMTQTVWGSVDRHDKVAVMFKYCSFFVNPLEQLVNMASSTDSQE